MEPTGFWQYWDMFAPDPAQTDIYLTAKVTYADGSSMIYHYPRMAELSIFWKYVKERYRKFYERAGSDQFQYLWPPTAQRIAFICDDRPGNPPVEVDLIRHWLQIYPPGKPQQKGYNTYTYFRYQVDPELLKETHEDN